MSEYESNISFRYSTTLEAVHRKLSKNVINRHSYWFSGLLALLSILFVFVAFIKHLFIKNRITDNNDVPNYLKKPKKGNYNKIRNRSTPAPEENTIALERHVDKILTEKNKYELNIARLDKLNAEVQEFDCIPVFIKRRLENAQKVLLALESELSKLEQQSRPKNKNERDDCVHSKKNLNSQINATKDELAKYKLILTAHDRFITDCNIAIHAKYQIQDADKLDAIIIQLVETRKILENESKTIAEYLASEQTKERKKFEEHVATLNVLKAKSMHLIKPLLDEVSSKTSEIITLIQESSTNVDLTSFHNTSEALTYACSDFAAMVNIDCKSMSLDEFTHHVTNVLEAEKILHPDHPWRKEFDDSYTTLQTCLHVLNQTDQSFSKSSKKKSGRIRFYEKQPLDKPPANSDDVIPKKIG